MLEVLRKELTAGAFSLSLPRCELRQCGVNSPKVYSGPGWITQQPDGNLLLRMFATEPLDERERMGRLFPKTLTPGILVPDDYFFDFQAVDQSGDPWRATRQSIHEVYGIGNEIHAPLRRLEKVETLSKPAAGGGCGWFIPGADIELPWHVPTRTPTSMSVDRFEGDHGDYSWKVHKADGGIEAEFSAARPPLEPSATTFLRALAMLAGHALEPLVSYAVEGENLITRIHPRGALPAARLAGPVATRLHAQEGAHRFLSCCLRLDENHDAPNTDVMRVLYRYWLRIARAHQGDIENSSLVLSVAIEGILKALFHSRYDTDEEFAAMVAKDLPAVATLPISERVRSSLLKHLEHAAYPKPKDTMRRLKEQGVLTDNHIAAWTKLRHTGAHGAQLEDEDSKLQTHLDRYFCCLDLFYRLLLLAVGYRGKFFDRSRQGNWGARDFLGIPTVAPEDSTPPESALGKLLASGDLPEE